MLSAAAIMDSKLPVTNHVFSSRFEKWQVLRLPYLFSTAVGQKGKVIHEGFLFPAVLKLPDTTDPFTKQKSTMATNIIAHICFAEQVTTTPAV